MYKRGSALWNLVTLHKSGKLSVTSLPGLGGIGGPTLSSRLPRDPPLPRLRLGAGGHAARCLPPAGAHPRTLAPGCPESSSRSCLSSCPLCQQRNRERQAALARGLPEHEAEDRPFRKTHKDSLCLSLGLHENELPLPGERPLQPGQALLKAHHRVTASPPPSLVPPAHAWDFLTGAVLPSAAGPVLTPRRESQATLLQILVFVRLRRTQLKPPILKLPG